MYIITEVPGRPGVITTTTTVKYGYNTSFPTGSNVAVKKPKKIDIYVGKLKLNFQNVSNFEIRMHY